MTKRAIVAAAVAALGAGAAWLSGCGGELPPLPSPPEHEHGPAVGPVAFKDGGGSTDTTVETDPCGCMAGGACEPGDSLELCGARGEACEACSFGETCHAGACVAPLSACVAMLEKAGLGGGCESDAGCATDEWCAASCCDPVGGACFAVWRCAPKRAPGEHCDHAGGDHQCSSGTCDPIADECD